ncbi:hypothetical protein CAOG_00288 [Capsaspora owczarzaki ATCC 30864]|uniref:Uncharacterized protein n=1 Tax=Capsaspora owczarzaki (strain ATCC 30864) TaxID=595528 RepID=A0A0D2VFY7_CAPO3|nr:hypothetical protein CAOG_00288 [Capsaspora owczarzaki ATCC 30864]KJE88682.1 hypothetical protein CAOG_000288 [Capsaspora owczarzaki ATCC 30864]|eukprot:XP_004365159.1 hypothetical protein CAOG_00288 [Capsaspora owczarzaki ATCC 30864]
MANVQNLLSDLARVEALAEEVLDGKQEMVELDRKRQSCREAVNGIKAIPPSEGSKLWMAIGPLFLRVQKDKAIGMIQKDRDNIDKQLELTRQDVKFKTAQLYELQNKPHLASGYLLNSLSSEDANVLRGRA